MTFFKETIRDVPLEHQTVLVRADYNVPLNDKGEIDDDLRIRASVPTINYLLERGCKVVIISHLGRPEGVDTKFTLEPVAARLAQLLHRDVRFINDTIHDRATQVAKRAPKNSVVMFENLRFDAREEADDMEYAKAIANASGARYFVQDGFGVVHRAHASTHAITMCLPSVSGLLLEKEYKAITGAMNHPKRPLYAVVGGAKVSDKISIINEFVAKADKIIIGGAMANTFLAYKGISVGASKYEPDQKETIDEIYASIRAKVGDNVDSFLVLPSDVAVATAVDADQPRRNVSVDQIGPDDKALDIGDQTIETIVHDVTKHAATVIWNGTLGFAELPNFAHGSARLAMALATKPAITSIIGGGDTADFIIKWDAKKGGSFSHVSTGGGASLELMAGDKLPGIESLLDARKQVRYTKG